ncbi:MAG: hypothetical protein FJ356_04075 [Thaumarchaeota archaeon]|nr:hypothetical protein [Nitrososphaerota archaeon]
MISHKTNNKSKYHNKNPNQSHSLHDYDNLAIKPSANDATINHDIKNWNNIRFDEFRLPGTKEAHYWCAEWKTLGCVNDKEHKLKGYGNKAFVNHFQRFCYRPDCKECYQKWIDRESDRATKRIKKYQRISGERPIHVVLSPSQNNSNPPEKLLRKQAMMILKEVNVKDGALILHPWRFDRTKSEWYSSPHYHFVGFGWFRNLELVARKYGWKVLYKGVRGNIFGTFQYLLSHCGIKDKRHAITWLGKLSYGKLKVEKTTKSNKCSICSKELVPIYYAGTHPVIPPDKPFLGIIDSEDWYEVKTLKNSN